MSNSPEFPQSNYHEATLTAGQAREINENFNIVVVGGWHCRAKSESDVVPSDINYDATNLLTSALDPAKGDTLFIEGIGYRGVPDGQLVLAMDPEWVKAKVGMLRDTQEIDSFNYAAIMAGLRGVRVEYADVHHDVYKDFLAKEDIAEDANLTPAQGKARNQLRNRQAVYTVKDDMLAHLEAVKASGVKATYMHLMGDAHVSLDLDGVQMLPEIYENLGLKIDVAHVMQAVAVLKIIEATGVLTGKIVDANFGSAA